MDPRDSKEHNYDITRMVKKYVANTNGMAGQQYAYMELRETSEPSGSNPAKNCTVLKFRDLLKDNAKTIGVLVIESHGNEGLIAVEPFGTVDQMLDKYEEYTKSKDKPPLFTTDEIKPGRNPPAISVTAKFIEKYQNLGNAFVYVNACYGATLTGTFTGKNGGRVAMGPVDCIASKSAFAYSRDFFRSLDGGESSGLERLQLRAVGPAMDAENKAVEKGEQYSLSGKGNTTLAPRVREEGGDYGFKCPLGKGDTINLVFDTECDKNIIPKIDTQGITLGPVAWQGNLQNVSHQLKIPVTGPEVPTRSYKFTLKGDTLQSGNDQATLDGNINPDMHNKDGSGLNAHGPANSKQTPDNYVVQYEDCKRVN